MDEPNFITMVATCVIALVAVSGVVFTVFQLRAMRRSRDMQFSVQVLQELRAPEWVARYQQLYNAPRDVQAQERHACRQDFERILDRLEWIGIMIARRSVPGELAALLIGGLPLRCWYMLYEYIRRRRDERGHYARYVEDFTKRSVKFQIVYQPYKEWTKLKIRDEPEIELVPELIKMKILSEKELRWAKFKRRLQSIRNPKLRMPKDEWLKLRIPK